MNKYTLIEGCCGSAALTLYLCGIKKSILPYQGSKWKFRKSIAQILTKEGFVGKPSSVRLYDPAPWSVVLKTLIKSKNNVVEILKQFNKEDSFDLFNKLNGSVVPKDIILLTAQFLFLQRLSFSGKAVGYSSGFWCSPGFNKSSAYGLKATSKFGEIKPMITSLINNLEKNSYEQIPLEEVGSKFIYPINNVVDTVIYLDPPYQSAKTKYPDGNLDRKELINLAMSWHSAGAKIIISEAEPIKELNWNRLKISEQSKNKINFQNKKEEWLTFNF